MTALVRVLAGPARSGKTAALLQRYRRALAEQPVGSALWLAPNALAAAEIRAWLLDDTLTGCFSPGVFTYLQFANAILQQSSQTPKFIGQLLRRRLLSKAIHKVHEAGQLQHFAAIAEKPGFVDQLAELISDLKRQEIWPAEFTARLNRLDFGPKTREVAEIYTAYQELLEKSNLFDAEGRFWSAREWLRQNPPDCWGPFAILTHIVVDGFADFTPTEQEILQLLATKLPRMVEMAISLPLEEESRRDDLFSKPRDTLAELQRRHPKLQIDWQARSTSACWPALTHLEQNVFDNPRRISPPTECQAIEVIATAGQKAELQWIARQIKELLVLGDDSAELKSVRPGDIVVVFRRVAPVVALVSEVFSEYGIPVAIEGSVPLARSPLLQALLGMLRLQAGNWPFRQLLAVVSNNYFQPNWPEWQNGKAAAAVDWAVRQAQIASGRDQLFETLARQAHSSQPGRRGGLDGDSDDEREAHQQQAHRERIQLAAVVLHRLAEELPSPNKARALSDWLGILDGLIDRFQLLADPMAESKTGSRGGESRDSIDRQSWNKLKDALAAEIQLDDWIGASPEMLDLAQLIDRLQEIMTIESLPADRDQTGKVRVLSAQSVRALEAPYLFVAGMSEKAFPLAAGDDRIYSEAECRRLNQEAGLHFAGRKQRAAEEMLLFYEVITRPTRRLVLSYPALDEAAQPLLPSPYLIELQRCLGIEARQEISLSPVLQHGEPCSAAEKRVKAVSELLNGKPRPLAELFCGDMPQDSTAAEDGKKLINRDAENIVASLKSIDARSRRDRFSRWEGMVDSERATNQLTRRFGPEYLWSASGLEKYAYCPFQFFAGHVLGLEELPELTLETDYGGRGIRAHEVLARLHRRLNSGGRTVAPTDIGDKFKSLTDDTIALVFESIPAGPLAAALQKVDLRLISAWMKEYFGQHQEYDELAPSVDQALRPAHFEVSFGLKRREDEQLDELSTTKPFELSCGGETIRLSGRIDRIDIGVIGGQVVFNVLDYKTGSRKLLKEDDVQSGRALQLPLYAMAVQELLMVDRRAVPWRVGYWYLKDKGFDKSLPQLFESFGDGLRETPNWNSLRGSIIARVASLVRNIRVGSFPVYSLDEDCTSQCPYSTICRIGQIRALDKTWPPTD